MNQDGDKSSFKDEVVSVLDSVDEVIEELLFTDLRVVDLEVFSDFVTMEEALGLLQQS
jgi:hypothetical protein